MNECRSKRCQVRWILTTSECFVILSSYWTINPSKIIARKKRKISHNDRNKILWRFPPIETSSFLLEEGFCSLGGTISKRAWQESTPGIAKSAVVHRLRIISHLALSVFTFLTEKKSWIEIQPMSRQHWLLQLPMRHGSAGGRLAASRSEAINVSLSPIPNAARSSR